MVNQEVTIQLTAEEAEIFDRVMNRLRAAAPLPELEDYNSHSAMLETSNFHGYCYWGNDGDFPCAPSWHFVMQYSMNANHCDGRRFWLVHPLRPAHMSEGHSGRPGPLDWRDMRHCSGCEACEPIKPGQIPVPLLGPE